MDTSKNNWSSLLITSALLVGSFAYIETLLFRPKMLTAYMSGDALFVSIEIQTLVTVVLIVVSSLCAAALLRKSSFIGRIFIGFCSFCLPLLCMIIVPTIQNPLVPFFVSLVLGISCSFQIQIALKKRPFELSSSLESYALSAIISLCISSLLSHLGYLFSEIDAFGTFFLALVMTTTGLMISFIRSTSFQERAFPSLSGGSQSERFRIMLRSVFPIAPAAIICAFSLGSAWDDDAFETALRMPYPFVIGVLFTVIFLFLLMKRWARRSEERDSEVVLFAIVPVAVGIFASFFAGIISSSLLFSLLLFSNLSLLALIWIEMLYLYGKRTFSSSVTPFLAILLVMIVFSFGVVLSKFIPKDIVPLIISTVALIYIVYLVFHAQKSTVHYASENNPHRSFEEIKALSCVQMGEDFGLSAKEGEVLALLVTGISAPAIGKKLFVSHETVKTHKYHIYQKIGVHNFEELTEVFENYANRM